MPILTKSINYTINGNICTRCKQLNLNYPLRKPANILLHDLKLLAPKSHTIAIDCICDQCHEPYTVLLHKVTLEEINNNYIICGQCKSINTRNNYSELQKQAILEKMKSTVLEKYGVTSTSLVPEIREKMKQTNLKRYGVEYPFQSLQIQNKIKNILDSRTAEEKQQQLEKTKQTNLEKYGCENASSNEEIKLKREQTNLERYGAKNPFSSEICKQKIKQTNLEKYGVECTFSNKEVRLKCEQTNLERYGAKNVFASPIIQERIKNTVKRKYGNEYTYSAQVPEIINKRIQTYNKKTEDEKREIIARARKSMYRNSTAMSSFQQEYFHKLLGGELNYPLFHLSLDIALLDKKINIEYNGGGHNLSVKLGNMTYNEFIQHEIKRNKFIKSLGWKQIIIIAPNDKIYNYTEQEYLKMFTYAKAYLQNTNHTWVEIYVENNKFRTSVYEQTITNIINL